ncbi:AAA family ATPase [Saccharothrix sp. S26]|uniref:AAA family ATPase n=1 Tax=Saccharothrix sp. S26 TaxID=2907215 RepID=UPI001F22B565|nr:AAA family ATPase [Saccharothrix sp. S26]MCE6997535.1 AAA family ATPase [Saccharothrix sp. S26]
MLLWINGPFGGGKTQTAHELLRRLPGSFLSDPEHVGFALHRMTPRALRGDFQDLASWRRGVLEVLDRAASGHDGVIVVPMTVVEPEYFREIVGGLRDRGHDVRHFALMAERETVVRRLRERGLGHVARVALGRDVPLRRESFALRVLDRCLRRLREPEFAEHVWTDHLTVPQVAERVAASAGLTLTPNTDGRLRGRVRRTWVSVKHIRFD